MTRSIYWIVLDGSRADPAPHAYRALDTLRTASEREVVFERTYTSAVSTAMSWLAILTAQPVHFYARDHASAELLRSPWPILPSILAEEGYENSFFIGHHETRRKIVHYFDTRPLDDFLGQSPDAGNLCNANDARVIDAFEAHHRRRDPARPCFSVIHLIQPAWYAGHYARLVGLLKSLGAWDRDVIVTSGDHGMDELCAEGTTFRHDTLLTQQNCLTVAKLRAPGLPSRVIPEPVLLMDLGPTLLDLAGLDRGIETRHALSLGPRIFRSRDGLVPLDRVIRIDNRYHEQVMSRTALIRDDLKLVVDRQRESHEAFALSEDFLAETPLAPGERSEEVAELLDWLDADDHRLVERTRGLDLAPPDVHLNVVNDLNYQLRLVDDAHYDPQRSHLLVFRTFNIEPFRALLTGALRFFAPERIHLVLQPTGEALLAESDDELRAAVERMQHYRVPDNLRDHRPILESGLKNGIARWALLPYNGREFIQYHAFLRALAELGIERVLVVNLRGHVTPLHDVERTLRRMQRFLEIAPEHETLRREFAQVNRFV